MEVQVAETGPCSRSLQIKITPEQVTEHLDEVYASASQQVQVKGFRPGKVPRKMIEKMHGPAILQQAKEQLMERYLGEACREHEIQPVGRVKVDEVESLEGVQWADWAADGRLLMATSDGRLEAWSADQGSGKTIVDFDSLQPDPRPTPLWASEW